MGRATVEALVKRRRASNYSSHRSTICPTEGFTSPRMTVNFGRTLQVALGHSSATAGDDQVAFRVASASLVSAAL